MKKIVLILCAAALALVSCNKQPMDVASAEAIDTPTDVVFNLSATHPDGAATKAVKSGWEEDDLVYVFFSEQAVPAYLALTYNGSTWESAAKNGLALTEGETGTMTAVFLPFGHGRKGEASLLRNNGLPLCFLFWIPYARLHST